MKGGGEQEGLEDTGVNLGSDLCKSVVRTAAVCGEHGGATPKQEEGEGNPNQWVTDQVSKDDQGRGKGGVGERRGRGEGEGFVAKT